MDSPNKVSQVRSDVSRLGAPARSHRLGQQLMATVINGSTTKGTTGNVLIRIGNQTLQVRSTMDLRLGDVLKLQVTRLQPQILLSVVAINGVKPSIAADPLTSALLQLQPRQGGLPELLSTLNAVASGRAFGDLSAQLSPYLRQLLNSFITLPEITESGALGQAFLNSGLFLESKLLSRKAIDRDFKASLLGLLRLLGEPEKPAGTKSKPKPQPRDLSEPALPPHRDAQPMPQPRSLPGDIASYSENQIQDLLRNLIEAALTRLTLHQIASVENARESKLRWLAEIPLHDGEYSDVLHLCITREDHGADNEAQDRWSAELALDLPALGPIRARVSLYKGKISSTLWAENTNTVEKLNSSLSRLEEALEACGMKIMSLACYAGKPVASERIYAPQPLIDVQA